MTEENGKWRCPYCDGLNDWHEKICCICGDGKRDETVPKEEKPQPDKWTESAQEEQNTEMPEAETEYSRTYETPAATVPGKKKGKAWIVWILMLLVIIIAGGIGYWKDTDRRRNYINRDYVITFTDDEMSENPPLSIRSLEDKGGSAEIVLQTTEPRTHYGIYVSCTGDYSSVNNTFFQAGLSDREILLETAESLGFDAEADDAGNGISTIPVPVRMDVVPGAWNFFIVHAFNDDEERGIWWRSEPYYFGEVDSKCPILIESAGFCEWDNADEVSAWYKNQYKDYYPDADGEPHDPHPVALSSAEDLNRRLENGAVLGYDLNISMTMLKEERSRWQKMRDAHYAASVVSCLHGPDKICLINTDSLKVKDDNYHDQYLSWDVFSSNYHLVKDRGGYPAGDYTLDFYIWGVKVYTMVFSL